MKPRRPTKRSAKRPVPRPAGPRPDPGLRPRHQGKAEEKYHGVHACEAIFARRPHDIIRIYLTKDRQRRFGPLIEHCITTRKGFQVVEPESLERLTGSVHHEGIAILARQQRRWNMADLLRAIDAQRLAGPMLLLDGVQNPHNLGSILRTAAHFGASVILGAEGTLPALSPAAVRVAEGAAEVVPVCDLANPVADLGRLRKAGYELVATSSHRGDPLFTAALGANVIIALGGEAEGVSRAIDAIADRRLLIPGTGAVESLNVAVACGLLLGEIWRHGRN
jgi:TrmH RNA methyltransferase